MSVTDNPTYRDSADALMEQIAKALENEVG